MTQPLTDQQLDEIEGRVAIRRVALTQWLNSYSPQPGQEALERAEGVLEEDVPALLAEVHRLRDELAAAPKCAYRVSEIRDGEVRRVHGYHVSLDGAFAYCETEERKKPLIDSVRFELFEVPGGRQWLIHEYYGPGDDWPETSDFVITEVDVIPDRPAVSAAAVSSATENGDQ